MAENGQAAETMGRRPHRSKTELRAARARKDMARYAKEVAENYKLAAEALRYGDDEEFVAYMESAELFRKNLNRLISRNLGMTGDEDAPGSSAE